MNPPALLLIDIQNALTETGFYGTERNNPDAEEHAGELLSFFRTKGWPIYHVRHDSTNPESPLVPGKPGHEINAHVAPNEGEPVFSKTVNSGFIGTALEATLKAAGITQLVIAGLTTEHCISTTTRMAANLGFENILVSDATAAFDKTDPNGKHYPASLVHEISLATLRDEFAEVLDTQLVLERLA
ncbi:MAG: cysteine hydrolase family protein [Bacteroidota bacterium]